jgi:pimeloyl-ACP methyl ester carboxylesterase
VVEALLDGYVELGYAVVATDYEGLGTPGTQAYLVGDGEARGALDIMRAARSIDPDIGTRYLVMGHSQGGHADLFTAAMGPTYAREFTLVGNVAIAPASHTGELMQAAITASNPTPILPFIAYLLQSYAAYYPEVALDRILAPEAINHLQDLQQSCIGAAVASGYWAEAAPKLQFLPSADLAPLLKAIAINEPGALKLSAPTLVIQGTADTTVPPAATDAVVRDLCDSGSAVRYRSYTSATHDGVLLTAKTDVEAWVAARFARIPESSNCDARPSGATAE